MRYILAFLSKGVGFKLVALLLVVGTGVMIVQLSGIYKGHALNVHTEIKATPPGIVMIIDQTGQLPSIYSDIGSSGENQPSGTESTSQSGTEYVTQSGTEPAMQPGTETTPPGDNTQPEEPPIPLVTDIIEKIIGGGGASSPSSTSLQSDSPTALIINTDVDFGTVFPGETVKGKFIVYLDKVSNTSSNTSWNTTYNWITYNVTLLEELDYTCEDIRPYLIVERDSIESDNETDPLADGTNNDYFAQGSLNVTDNDTFDKWFVTFNVTDNISLNDYGAEVLIEVIDGEKAGG